MAVSQPKKKLTKEEIIDILRRNAKLFRNEPEFITYIVDLALYLIEDMLDRGEPKKTTDTPFQVSPQEIKQVYSVLQHFSSEKSHKRTCPLCGCATEGKRKCPNCDAMTF